MDDVEYLSSRQAEDEALALLNEINLLEQMNDPPPAFKIEAIGTKAVAWALIAVVRELRNRS